MDINALAGFLKENPSGFILMAEQGNGKEGTLKILNNIAATYTNNDQNKEGLEHYLIAYDYAKRSFGENDIKAASVCYDVALLYYTIGNNSEALSYAKKALAVYIKENHSDAASVKNATRRIYENSVPKPSIPFDDWFKSIS